MKTWLGLRIACFAFTFIAIGAHRNANAAATLLNGSFEIGAIPPGTSETGSSGLFWHARDVNLLANPFPIVGSTPFGNQYILMNPGPLGTDEQLVAGFLSGETYAVAFYFASIWGDVPHDAAVSLTISGAATGVFAFTGPAGLGTYAPGNIQFEVAKFIFTTKEDGAVNFLISNLGSAELAVDNVSLRQVPETASNVLLLEGASLLGLFFGWRVRKGRNVAGTSI